LSLCQAHLVQARLEERLPHHQFHVKTISATADRKPDTPLTAFGGEGIFVKELEQALVAGRIDLAVHSLKDVPLALASGLMIAAVLERDDPADACVSGQGRAFEALPSGARVGTSSVRRRSQALRLRPDLVYEDIRGNVDTRLRKVENGQYDAVILAACGLIRLGLEERINTYFTMEQMLPEPGQGALAIEVRQDDHETLEAVGSLEDPLTRACVEAERAFLGALGGGCHVPIAALVQLQQGHLVLDGAVIAPDGGRLLRERATGDMTAPIALGELLAARLIAQGAKELLR
jgi:hydroxymethylbilane synthase